MRTFSEWLAAEWDTDEDGLVRAVLARPTDKAPLGVLFDYWEEHGQAADEARRLCDLADHVFAVDPTWGIVNDDHLRAGRVAIHGAMSDSPGWPARREILTEPMKRVVAAVWLNHVNTYVQYIGRRLGRHEPALAEIVSNFVAGHDTPHNELPTSFTTSGGSAFMDGLPWLQAIRQDLKPFLA